jgi:mannose/fructose-specific phosphotransferase system component IIA
VDQHADVLEAVDLVGGTILQVAVRAAGGHARRN